MFWQLSDKRLVLFFDQLGLNLFDAFFMLS